MESLLEIVDILKVLGRICRRVIVFCGYKERMG